MLGEPVWHLYNKAWLRNTEWQFVAFSFYIRTTVKALMWSIHGCWTATRWCFGSTGETQKKKGHRILLDALATFLVCLNRFWSPLCTFRAGTRQTSLLMPESFMLQRPLRKQSSPRGLLLWLQDVRGKSTFISCNFSDEKSAHAGWKRCNKEENPTVSC